MQLLTGLIVLLMEYNEEDDCDCEEAGTCRCCLTRAALDEATRAFPDAFVAAEGAWWREVEARFAPAAAVPAVVVSQVQAPEPVTA